MAVHFSGSRESVNSKLQGVPSASWVIGWLDLLGQVAVRWESGTSLSHRPPRNPRVIRTLYPLLRLCQLLSLPQLL